MILENRKEEERQLKKEKEEENNRKFEEEIKNKQREEEMKQLKKLEHAKDLKKTKERKLKEQQENERTLKEKMEGERKFREKHEKNEDQCEAETRSKVISEEEILNENCEKERKNEGKVEKDTILIEKLDEESILKEKEVLEKRSKIIVGEEIQSIKLIAERVRILKLKNKKHNNSKHEILQLDNHELDEVIDLESSEEEHLRRKALEQFQLAKTGAASNEMNWSEDHMFKSDAG